MHKFLFYNKFIIFFYMFRALLCSSSGGQYVLYSIWYHHTLSVAVRCTGALALGKRPGTHFTGGLEGPRAGMDGCGKSRTPPGFDSRTVEPVASRYTDCSIAQTTNSQ